MKAALSSTLALVLFVASGGCASSSSVQNGGGSPQIPTSDSTSAYYRFDGNLIDTSVHNHTASGTDIKFVQGQKGSAADLNGQSLEILSSPDLQLQPGLTIDCWVYFDAKQAGYQMLVMKDMEYQLRVDSEGEGGRISFFVYLDGWEPRVSNAIPVEPKTWYHVVAKWTGTEATLSVNNEMLFGQRTGTPIPTNNSLIIGKATCRIDELTILVSKQ